MLQIAATIYFAVMLPIALVGGLGQAPQHAALMGALFAGGAALASLFVRGFFSVTNAMKVDELPWVVGTPIVLVGGLLMLIAIIAGVVLGVGALIWLMLVRAVARRQLDRHAPTEPTSGFEPLTPSLRVKCSTS